MGSTDHDDTLTTTMVETVRHCAESLVRGYLFLPPMSRGAKAVSLSVLPGVCVCGVERGTLNSWVRITPCDRHLRSIKVACLAHYALRYLAQEKNFPAAARFTQCQPATPNVRLESCGRRVAPVAPIEYSLTRRKRHHLF